MDDDFYWPSTLVTCAGDFYCVPLVTPVPFREYCDFDTWECESEDSTRANDCVVQVMTTPPEPTLVALSSARPRSYARRPRPVSQGLNRHVRVLIFNVKRRAHLCTLCDHFRRGITSLASVAPSTALNSAPLVVVGTLPDEVSVWHAECGDCLYDLESRSRALLNSRCLLSVEEWQRQGNSCLFLSALSGVAKWDLGRDGGVCVCRTASAQQLRRDYAMIMNGLDAIRSRNLIVGWSGHSVRLFDRANCGLVDTLNFAAGRGGVSCSGGDGNMIVVAGRNGVITVHDVRDLSSPVKELQTSLQVLKVPRPFSNVTVRDMAFVDNDHFASGCENFLTLWSLNSTKTETLRMPGDIRAVCVIRDRADLFVDVRGENERVGFIIDLQTRAQILVARICMGWDSVLLGVMWAFFEF